MSNVKKSGPNASDDQNRKDENNDNIIGRDKNVNNKSFLPIVIQEVIAGSAYTIVLTFQNELFAAGWNKFG